MPTPALRGRCVLAASLGEHGVEHAHHRALVGLGQRADALELLLNLRRWPALAGRARCRCADQVFNADVQGLREQRQQRNRHPALAALVGGDGLL